MNAVREILAWAWIGATLVGLAIAIPYLVHETLESWREWRG
jgi:hypothetical protein